MTAEDKFQKVIQDTILEIKRQDNKTNNEWRKYRLLY